MGNAPSGIPASGFYTATSDAVNVMNGGGTSSNSIGGWTTVAPTGGYIHDADTSYLDPYVRSGFDSTPFGGKSVTTTTGSNNNGLKIAANQNWAGKQFPYNSPAVVNQINSGKKLKRIPYATANNYH